MRNEFIALIEKHEADLNKNNVIFSVLGYVKLALVFLIGAFAYCIISKGFRIELILSCAMAFTVLAVLWVYHSKIYERINYSKGIISICNQQIDRITGKWTAFDDIGEEYVDAEHAYGCDLDIVGSKSLFQFLNTTHTWHGRKAFANDLLHPAYGSGELRKRQEAIAELRGDLYFSCDIQYRLSKIGTDPSTVKLVDELTDKTPFIKNSIVKILLTYAPIMTFVLIAGIIAFQQKSLYLMGVIIAIIQAILWIAGMPKTHNYLGTMARLPYRLNAYSTVIDVLINKDFSSERLKHINAQLNLASQAIKDLSKIADKVSVKHNGIIYFLANIFFCGIMNVQFCLRNGKENMHIWPNNGF